jgi:CHASE1-domain containing sensor protein
MRVYEDALLGGKSFFKATDSISEKSWKSYVDTLQIVTKYPGINGIGVIYNILNSQEIAFLKKLQNEIKEFKIKPVPNVLAPAHTNNKFVITYIIPYKTNHQAQGLDVGSESNRRTAAELSRDLGESTITEPIILVQDFTKKPGFLLFVPIYTSEETPNTVEERRNSFVGWIYAPFITEKFFKGIFTEEE